MLRFGTVGTSRICSDYITGALGTGLWEYSACYSRNYETGKAFAENFGVDNIYTNLEAMAKSSDIDAVYIASPNFLHVEQSLLFLKNGKHVICEKPVSSHAEDVRMLHRIARENNVIFLEAMMYMHMPAREIFTKAIKTIGDIPIAHINFCRKSKQLQNLLDGKLPNIFNPKMEAGGLMDIGIYTLYPVVDLFGMPSETHISAKLLDNGADACGSIIFRYPERVVTMNYSKISETLIPSEFQGEKGILSCDSISLLSGMTLTDEKGNSEKLMDYPDKKWLMGFEARDLYRYITEPDNTKEEYDYCLTISENIAELLEQLRKDAGIFFPTD
ncbi:MAG: Gfo/Idh/MocA family oxidoreductase [Clostridia bacterium]|nr:Gfo/Idh/MocA family oxidoreductase [Clostridia bacterium]